MLGICCRDRFPIKGALEEKIQFLENNPDAIARCRQFLDADRWDPFLTCVAIDAGMKNLTQLPNEVSMLRRIQTLFFDGNLIGKLPPEIGGLQTLRELDVKGNQLRELPREIGKLESLQTLNLDYNLFDNVPRVLLQIQSLKRLHLAHNALRNFYDYSKGEMKGLVWADMRGNRELRVNPNRLHYVTEDLMWRYDPSQVIKPLCVSKHHFT